MIYSLEWVHENVLDKSVKKVEVDGYRINVTSVRLKTFATKGTECICCGVKGTHYKIDGGPSQAHFNLYTDTGVLLTKDHEICKSHGGKDTLDNMNPMCYPCNNLRGNRADLGGFIADYRKHGPAGYRLKDEMVVKWPEIEDLIADHVAQYGIDSHLKKIYVHSITKKHKRDALLEYCKDIGDHVGERILGLLRDFSPAQRKKVRSIARSIPEVHAHWEADRRSALGGRKACEMHYKGG